MPASKPILVVAGVGNASGTGAATARLFAKNGYSVALIARSAKQLEKAADEIKSAGGDAAPFPINKYDYSDISGAFTAIKKHWPDEKIRVALWNAGLTVFKPFLDTSEEELKETLQTNTVAAFSFAREAILTFKDQEVDDVGARGTLLFTTATASLRGGPMTAAFAAGKHGIRALSQSLNKEFGKQNIHVAQAVIDGNILTDMVMSFKGGDKAWAENEDARLNPESIAKAYLYLARQDRSAWTFELDLRPAHEKW